MEFPTEGKFTSIGFGRYRVVGDTIGTVGENFQEPPPTPRPFTGPKSWAVPRPWSTTGAGPSSLSKRATVSRPLETVHTFCFTVFGPEW